MTYDSILIELVVALPPEMRKTHAKELSTLTKLSGNILLITLEYPQEKVAARLLSVPKTGENLFNLIFILKKFHESTKNMFKVH